MESVLDTFLETNSLDEIVAGAAIDLSEVYEENKPKIAAVLLHCCVNGPFTPHDTTTYPVIGDARLDDLVGRRVSNNGLKKTCESVKEWLKEQSFDKGYMFETYGDFWPNNGFEPRPRSV